MAKRKKFMKPELKYYLAVFLHKNRDDLQGNSLAEIAGEFREAELVGRDWENEVISDYYLRIFCKCAGIKYKGEMSGLPSKAVLADTVEAQARQIEQLKALVEKYFTKGTE